MQPAAYMAERGWGIGIEYPPQATEDPVPGEKVGPLLEQWRFRPVRGWLSWPAELAPNDENRDCRGGLAPDTLSSEGVQKWCKDH
jgi:hypothetical protein